MVPKERLIWSDIWRVRDKSGLASARVSDSPFSETPELQQRVGGGGCTKPPVTKVRYNAYDDPFTQGSRKTCDSIRGVYEVRGNGARAAP